MWKTMTPSYRGSNFGRLREVAEKVSIQTLPVQTLPGVTPFEVAHFIDLGSFKKGRELK